MIPRAWRWFPVPALIAVLTWGMFLSDRSPGTTAARDGLPLDDAWIHLVYARSLIAEGGFNYNRGVPETGMTSPLWVVLAAPVHALASPAGKEATVLAIKLLSLLCGFAGLAALYALVLAIGEGALIAAIAASIAALDPSLTFTRAAGMEMPLFSCLLLAALALAVNGRTLGASAAAGLAVTARPEGLVALPFVILLLIRAERRRTVVRPARALAALALMALPAALYAAFCLFATGVPLPNTFYAKFSSENSFSAAALAFGWTHYIEGNLPYFTAGIGAWLALLGATRFVRRRPLEGFAILGAGFVLFAGTLMTRHFPAGHFHYWERWLVPVFPILILAMTLGLAELRDGFASLRRAEGDRRGAAIAPSRPRWAATLAILAAALLLWALPGAQRERAAHYAWNCQNIEEMNVAAGRWLGATLAPDAVVAVIDAGAIRYFGERHTLDLMGLNEHRLLRGDPSAAMRPLRESSEPRAVLFPTPGRELILRYGLEPVRVFAASRYTITDGPQDSLVVYRWPQESP